jgi:hypothetical protein
MAGKRKQHTAAFKAQVALGVLGDGAATVEVAILSRSRLLQTNGVEPVHHAHVGPRLLDLASQLSGAAVVQPSLGTLRGAAESEPVE